MAFRDSRVKALVGERRWRAENRYREAMILAFLRRYLPSRLRIDKFIRMSWRGQPRVSHEVMINLIANTRTRSGLQVRVELEPATYPTGVKVSDQELMALNRQPDDFHGNWNYAILPNPSYL